MQPSGFPFGKEVLSYRQTEVITPFQKQNQLFDKPIGQLIHKAYVWRVVFFCGVSLSFILSLILVGYLNAIPYKILVEQVTSKGFLKSPPEFLSPNYTVSQTVLAGFIKSLLVNGQAGGIYHSFLDEDSQLALKQGVLGISKIDLEAATFDKFRVNALNFSGELVDKSGKAILEVSGQFGHRPLTAKEQVKLNPLGIYIQNLAIERLL
ncbi:hypothetical protein [Cysteiniphilum halobium]|uniref:hypothetical protein n=1 Tax=Cysteiniphilum halobium TaxID=2219059 RepID=UPI000E65B7D9|nr:hypothetical protein [Cysteiniphilum halobium]